MKLGLNDILFRKLSGDYLLTFLFDAGVRRTLSLSAPNLLSGDAIVRVTSDGFLPRTSFSFSVSDSDPDLYYLHLPTVCGYKSIRGKWIRSGRYHSVLQVHMSKLLDVLLTY